MKQTIITILLIKAIAVHATEEITVIGLNTEQV